MRHFFGIEETYQFVGASATSKRLTLATIGLRWFTHWSSDVLSLRCMKGIFIHRSDHTHRSSEWLALLTIHVNHTSKLRFFYKLQCMTSTLYHTCQSYIEAPMYFFISCDKLRCMTSAPNHTSKSYIGAPMFEHAFQQICMIIWSPFFPSCLKQSFNFVENFLKKNFGLEDTINLPYMYFMHSIQYQWFIISKYRLYIGKNW